MELIDNLALGFSVALSFEALLFCALGVTAGMAIGVLPGVGPLAAIAMLLPLTFNLSPMSALIMLAGIHYGTQYGGSIAAILLRLPGTASAAVTSLDGYPMAQNGRPGPALFLTTVASFFGGCVAVIVIAGFAPPLARMALAFGPAEFFAIIVLGLIAASTISSGSPVKGLAMVFVGLLLGLVGTDINSAVLRFTFDFPDIYDGVGLVPLAVGLFGISEVIANISRTDGGGIVTQRITLRSLIPTGEEMRTSGWPIFRGTIVGSIFGALPGAGTAIASFVAYGVEKRISRYPEKFGKGAVEGVTAPESANNAAAQTAFVPTLTLGVPGDPVMALLLGALLIFGITPGPGVVTNEPELFWGLIASFWIGNLLLLILNVPLIGVWVWFLRVPQRFLYPAILLFICMGVYSIRSSPTDLLLAALFGVIGYGMRLMKFEPAPLILGFILGPMIEEFARRALLISGGDLTTFVTRPMSATFLAVALLLLLLSFRRRPKSQTTQIPEPEQNERTS
ncbi:MAG: tripartite tricarboxylate transporter permease [Alphaproteobacteria bacterium]